MFYEQEYEYIIVAGLFCFAAKDLELDKCLFIFFYQRYVEIKVKYIEGWFKLIDFII